jgi:hypothetical protein
MAEWIYFLHPPRENFAATMTEEERAAFAAHAEWLGRLLADGSPILASPTLGPVNTGIGIFEAPDEETGRRIIADDPVVRNPAAALPLRAVCQQTGYPIAPTLAWRRVCRTALSSMSRSGVAFSIHRCASSVPSPASGIAAVNAFVASSSDMTVRCTGSQVGSMLRRRSTSTVIFEAASADGRSRAASSALLCRSRFTTTCASRRDGLLERVDSAAETYVERRDGLLERVDSAAETYVERSAPWTSGCARPATYFLQP